MRLAALTLSLALGGIQLAPITAATVQSTHVQRIVGGAARMTTYSDGTGTLYVNLKGLRAGRWNEHLHLGTCDRLGRRVAVLPGLVVGRDGRVTRTNRLTAAQARGKTLRLLSGSTALCVTFGSPDQTGILVGDGFDRQTTSGWSTAPAGGAYSTQESGFSVDGATGLMRLGGPGANLLAEASATNVRDVSLSFRVATDRHAMGDRQYAYAEARRVGLANAYRLGIRFGTNGGVFVQAGRVVNDAETALGQEVRVPGVGHAPNVFVRVRGEVAGTNPTRLRMRAWADGQAEPDTWAYVVNDWTTVLQNSGGIGLRAYLPDATTNPPVVARFDDFYVTAVKPPPPEPEPASEVLVGAGDIAVCGSEVDSATARLIRDIPGVVFTAGDNVYPNGTATEFANCYEPAWGSFRSRTRPVPGNHDYNTRGATGYYGYFGAAAGKPGEGWYAYDLGAWRIYALNSNCGIVRCEAGSPQEQWLRADLAANPRRCVAAIWHHPYASSRGGDPNVTVFWRTLYEAGADLVISGHDHDYERFAPLNATGGVDRAGGMRLFIVGTGGVGLNSFGATQPGSEVRNNATNGVIKLTLHSSRYAWEFIPVAGKTFRDSGETICH